MKIKIIASIFNKIRLISLYSKFCEGGMGRKNLCVHLRRHMKAYRCVQGGGRGLKTVKKAYILCTSPLSMTCVCLSTFPPLKSNKILNRFEN